jgi:hypothetical protein
VFAEGLLPRSARVVATRELLKRIVIGLGADVPTRPGRTDTSTGRNDENRAKEGPCGYLIREDIHRRSAVTNDYLRTSELVQDLACDIGNVSCEELLRAFHDETRPCIVTFRTANERDDVVPMALLYCYDQVWKESPEVQGYTYINRMGEAVPAADIISVDYVADNVSSSA